MKGILHSLRNKPDHIKTRYVIVLSVIATVIVVGVWITTLRLVKTNDDTIKTDSPFKIFGKLFSGAISDTQKTYQDQKQSLDTSLQTANSQDSGAPVTPTTGTEGTPIITPNPTQ